MMFTEITVLLHLSHQLILFLHQGLMQIQENPQALLQRLLLQQSGQSPLQSSVFYFYQVQYLHSISYISPSTRTRTYPCFLISSRTFTCAPFLPETTGERLEFWSVQDMSKSGQPFAQSFVR